MSGQLFYLTSSHRRWSTREEFHGVDGCGYTTDLDKAGKITLEKAQTEVDHDNKRRGGVKAYACELVDSLSKLRVDCQYLPEKEIELLETEQYYIVKNNSFDGNDVLFAKSIGFSFDFDEAKALGFNDISDFFGVESNQTGFSAYKVGDIRKIARKTLATADVNIRKMMQNKGIKYKTPRKARPENGKVKMNCPVCGRINWQYNPYEFDGCSNIYCYD